MQNDTFKQFLVFTVRVWRMIILPRNNLVTARIFCLHEKVLDDVHLLSFK